MAAKQILLGRLREINTLRDRLSDPLMWTRGFKPLTQAEAERWVDTFWHAFPELRAYQRAAKKYGLKMRVGG